MSESRSSLLSFGADLVDTGDLDPVYVVLWESGWAGYESAQQWLLAYWCFYHSGTASWIVDQPDYWTAMSQAAGSSRWPRSSERRHYRGDNARKSMAFLRSAGLTHLMSPLVGPEPVTVDFVMKSVQKWVGFGPWIAFKVADMLDRLNLRPIIFNRSAMFLFDSPLRGAKLAAQTYANPDTALHTDDAVVDWAMDYILTNLKDRSAPPRHERGLGVQEAETILCKWKSHMNGHYKVGEDIISLRQSLLKFARVKTSQRLLRAGKSGKLW